MGRMDHWRFMICIEIVIMIYMKSLFSPEKPIVQTQGLWWIGADSTSVFLKRTRHDWLELID